MKNYKNYLIAILAGMLALSLSTQSSNGVTAKTYDAVKLAEYSACLLNNSSYPLGSVEEVSMTQSAVKACVKYHP